MYQAIFNIISYFNALFIQKKIIQKDKNQNFNWILNCLSLNDAFSLFVYNFKKAIGPYIYIN